MSIALTNRVTAAPVTSVPALHHTGVATQDATMKRTSRPNQWPKPGESYRVSKLEQADSHSVGKP